MKDEYIKLISELDRTIDLLRTHWLEAQFKDKARWLSRIDTTLDERLRLMALRDA